MNAKGWRPFWAALLAGLLVLVPLVGGTVLLTRRTLRTKLASRPQSGVAIRQPKEENRLSLLVCTAPTETTAPGFLLLYLSASQNCIHALALPAAGKHCSLPSPCLRTPTTSPLRPRSYRPSLTGTGRSGWAFRAR